MSSVGILPALWLSKKKFYLYIPSSLYITLDARVPYYQHQAKRRTSLHTFKQYIGLYKTKRQFNLPPPLTPHDDQDAAREILPKSLPRVSFSFVRRISLLHYLFLAVSRKMAQDQKHSEIKIKTYLKNFVKLCHS